MRQPAGQSLVLRNDLHSFRTQSFAMPTDPWSRPTLAELREVLESIGRSDARHNRTAERLELSVPAEILTRRGNTVAAVTREISRFGIGLLHKGFVAPEEVTIRMASDTREFEYHVMLEWCRPCDNGMFISGGRFVGSRTAVS